LQLPITCFFKFSDEVPKPFGFKGKITDGKLDGPGKLKLGPNILSDDYTTCLKVRHFPGQDIVEVIGTFVNGVLHGNAKFVLADGKVVIASYVNGLADGLSRDWDEKGALTSVSFFYKGVKVGKSWQLIGKSLVYLDASTLNRSDDLTIVIPFLAGSTNTQILAGKFWTHISVLNDVQQVKNVKLEKEEDGCILNFSLELEMGQNLALYYDIQWDQFIKKFDAQQSAENCQDFDTTGSSTSQKLEMWFKKMNDGTQIEHLSPDHFANEARE